MRAHQLNNKIWMGFKIASFCMTFLALGCSRVDTPEKLLKQIHSLASQEKYEELTKHIYPFQDFQKMIVECIKKRKKTGSLAYSDEALLVIIHKYKEMIVPISKNMLDYQFRKGPYNKDAALVNIALSLPQDIMVFDYEPVFILMVKFEGEYKLLYWEHLPAIIRK